MEGAVNLLVESKDLAFPFIAAVLMHFNLMASNVSERGQHRLMTRQQKHQRRYQRCGKHKSACFARCNVSSPCQHQIKLAKPFGLPLFSLHTMRVYVFSMDGTKTFGGPSSARLSSWG